MLNIVLLCCMTVYQAPHRKPVRQCWITPAKLAILQAAAVTADGITTRQFEARGFIEKDPLVRPLIGGNFPTYQRMIPLGAAEVLGSYFLARKYPRMRWLQLSFTVTHGICAARNSRL